MKIINGNNEYTPCKSKVLTMCRFKVESLNLFDIVLFKRNLALEGKMDSWDGYITGKTVELRPYSRIVQKWRTTYDVIRGSLYLQRKRQPETPFQFFYQVRLCPVSRCCSARHIYSLFYPLLQYTLCSPSHRRSKMHLH